MRRVSFTNSQFRDLVYPFLARSVAQDAGEWDVQLELLRALKDAALTEEVPLTPNERAAEEGGTKVYRFRELRDEQAAFLLSEESWRLLKKRLDAQKTGIAAIAAEDYADLLKQVAEAPEVKVAAVPDAPEAAPEPGCERAVASGFGDRQGYATLPGADIPPGSG